MKLNPAAKLYALGAVLCFSLMLCSHYFVDRGGPAFMASLIIAAIAYLLAVRQLFATQDLAPHMIVTALVLAALWHAAFLRLPAGPDDDIHRYVWDGRLQRLGYNPYLVIPRDPAVAALHTNETRNLNNPDLPSLYPPGAELFFRGVTAIHESTFALKVAFVFCEFAILVLIFDVLRSTGKPAHLVLAFAWNPLLPIEVAGSGHIDIVGTMFLLLSAAALLRRWRMISAIALGLAVAVKFLPLVLLPLYWKRVRIRDVVAAAAAVAFLYIPFLDHGRIPMGSLGAYVQTFRFNGPVFAALNHVAPPRLLAAFAVLIGLVIAIWFRRSSQQLSPKQFAWPMAATLLCAPVVFPWYLLWLLPFLTSSSTLLLIIWTVSIIPVYVQWHLRTLGHSWGALPGWTMLVEYGCLAVAVAMIALRRNPRAAIQETPSDH